MFTSPQPIVFSFSQQETSTAGEGSYAMGFIISWKILGSAIHLQTFLTGQQYLHILSNSVHTFMLGIHADELGSFQQNHVPPHNCR